jgi:hypothetical protein
MASTYSTNLQTQLPATGDQSGQWGTTTNVNLGTLLEQAISSYCTQAFSNADITLAIANGADAPGGASNNPGVIYTAGTTLSPVSARNMYIECTGTINSTQNLIVPTNKKLYLVYNHTTGGALTVTTNASDPTAGISIPSGAKAFLVCNGTAIVPAINSITTGTGSTAWTLTLPSTVGTASYVLASNGDGTTSWVAQTGGGGGGSLVVGTSSVTGGTSGYILYNNAGVLGNLSVIGTGSVELATQTYTTLNSTAVASAYNRYHLNSSGGAFTVTLPSAANAGDWIQFIDVAQSCGTNNVTLGNNGLKIMNNSASMAININSAAFYLVYDTTYGWVVS